MATLDDFTEFALLTEAIAKDPLQPIAVKTKAEWDFQLKSHAPEAANLYQRIPALARDEYGLENLGDFCDAYRRPRSILPPDEENTELPKTLQVCGVEMRYARPPGIPGSDSELTDSDFESDRDSILSAQDLEESSDKLAASTTSYESHIVAVEKPSAVKTTKQAKGRTSEGFENSFPQQTPAAHDAVVDSVMNSKNSDESLEIHDETCDTVVRDHNEGTHNSKFYNTGNLDTKTENEDQSEQSSEAAGSSSELVYGYASTVSPSSRRMSRVSIAGMAHYRRCSVSTGVQPELTARDFMASPADVREAKRRSIVEMRESRKSVAFSSINVLGFHTAVHSRSEVFVCEVAGRPIELVIANCSRPEIGGAGTQCSAADIDGAMDALFAEILPAVNVPPKREKIDAGVQWTGGPEASQCNTRDFQDEIRTPDKSMPSPNTSEELSSPLPTAPSRGMLRKSAPASIAISGNAFSRRNERKVATRITSGKQKDGETTIKTARQTEESNAKEPHLVQESALQAIDEAMQLVETMEHEVEKVFEGVQVPENELPVSDRVFAAETKQKRSIADKLSIADTSGIDRPSIDITAGDTQHEAEDEQVVNAAGDVPDVQMDDDEDFGVDDMGFPDDEYEAEPEATTTTTEVVPSLNDEVRATDSDNEVSSFSRQRNATLMETRVDVEPHGREPSGEENISTRNKKRVRGKKPRTSKTRNGKKSGSKGTAKRDASRGELKRLGLSSVYLPKDEKTPEEGGDGKQPRRSKRRKFPPLQYWKNEKKVYERRMSQLLPTISEVVVAVDQVDGKESDVAWGDLRSRGVVGSRR